ncbi:uncharacterized protein CXorf66-like, partial [Suricata suricatta]|uniref:uncharacterized protein CXorf66-like n=1 Tax=Suricata suricatta TaxID=37032 RepID=UPI001155E207
LKKKRVTAKTARLPSKMSLSDPKTLSPCSPEKQPLLSSIDKLSSVSSPKKSPTPSSAERLSRPSSPQNQCTPSSIPKGIKPSDQGKKKPSCSDKIFQLFHLGKSNRTGHLGKPYKPARARKLAGQAVSSDPKKAVSPSWPASVQYTVRRILPLCPPHPQNPTSTPKRSCVLTLAQSFRHRELKRSVFGHRADMFFRPQSIKACRCYKKRCLVCQSSEPLVNNISEAKNRNAQNPLFASEGKPFTQSFLKADYRDNVFYGNVNGNDIMTYEN